MRIDRLRPSLHPCFAALVACVLLAPMAGMAQDAATYVARGDSLLRIQKPQRAIGQYEQALKLDRSADHLLARSKAWFVMERMDRFLLDVEEVLRMDSTRAEAHYLRALYAMGGEDHIRAQHHADRAIAHGAEGELRGKSLLLRGEARAALKRDQEAIADLQQGLDIVGDDVLAMTVLARLYDGVGRHKDALRILEILCDREPRSIGHWINRGHELNMLARYSDALPIFGYALGLDKDEPVALSGRAYALLMLDRPDEAWPDVEQSLRYYPTNPYALRTRALLLLRKGELVKACEDLNFAKAVGDLPEVDQLLKEHCSGATRKDE